jgi:regulator of cell morphogenesis and NO signaling
VAIIKITGDSDMDFTAATLKSIVTEDFRAASVFETYSLDFCCRGGKTISEACAEKGIDPTVVLTDLAALKQGSGPEGPAFTEWPLDFLADYIINNHHRYVRTAIPVILTHTEKIVQVHGDHHPELRPIAGHFVAVADELTHHMIKEEQMLFPLIRSIVAAANGNSSLPGAFSIQNPIRMMEVEHAAAGDTLFKIRELSESYTPPEDACTTYRVTYQELKQFEEDLHHHVHLENNILFPKAIALEQKLSFGRTS